jgi:hypothetical protein
MRTGMIVLALGTLMASAAEAQSRWVASPQGGYSASTSSVAIFPGGGSIGLSGFLGYDVSYQLSALGASLGGGVDWSPGNGRWSLGGALRMHGLIGISDGEGYQDLFVTLLAGVGYRW